MVTIRDIISSVNALPITERLLIVEEILRNIREEAAKEKAVPEAKQEGPAILILAGIIDEEEAKVMRSAVEESRKIDENEW